MALSEDRPLLTFALFAYNQEKFITEAVQGALSQTYTPLEIILSDDCSSDRTFEIMQELAAAYQGPNQVIARRNERNLGLIGHINRVMELVQGELIVVAAGDDISLPHRTEIMYDAYLKSSAKAYCIFSRRWKEIDAVGNILGDKEFRPGENHSFDLEYFGKTMHFVPGHSNSWHRSVFDVFGPIDKDMIGEDVVIPFRAALLGQVIPIDESLIFRRLHNENMSGPNTISSFKGKYNWYKERQNSIVRNRIGIARSFLSDLKKVRKLMPEKWELLERLSISTKRYLDESLLELDYINADFSGRLQLIKQGILIGVPFLKYILWFFGNYISVLIQFFPMSWLYKKYREHKIKSKKGVV